MGRGSNHHYRLTRPQSGRQKIGNGRREICLAVVELDDMRRIHARERNVREGGMIVLAFYQTKL